jgi:hypothetical protein
VTTSAARTTTRATTLDRAIEGAWLGSLALLPLMIVHESWIAGMIQVPKVFLLRTVALLLVILLTFEWASARPRRGSSWLALAPSAVPGRAWKHLRAHPILAATLAVIYANVLSAALSPIP